MAKFRSDFCAAGQMCSFVSSYESEILTEEELDEEDERDRNQRVGLPALSTMEDRLATEEYAGETWADCYDRGGQSCRVCSNAVHNSCKFSRGDEFICILCSSEESA